MAKDEYRLHPAVRSSFSETYQSLVIGRLKYMNRFLKPYIQSVEDISSVIASVDQFVKDCQLNAIEAQEQVCRQVVDLADARYWQYLKKSGGLDRRLEVYQNWRTTLSVLQDLMTDPHAWYSKSPDIRRLIDWLTEEVQGNSVEENELQRHYPANQPTSDLKFIVAELTTIVEGSSPSIPKEAVYAAITRLISDIYPEGLLDRQNRSNKYDSSGVRTAVSKAKGGKKEATRN